ncbi:Cu,Zn superoxide dismutase-like protein [Xylona heveae TC161]|uniref:superoxide dismutase n=1 Tax=Xylona heveae (strain CBS 132557 / TC161) TaxID=1328760 RepID=A0A165JPS5_XYLHT|nr:Cu,Zn superoxide dismutase-like protein [Xylona heveae TC161]KZF26493.1 Cu,Zn superoxide dismutase-like protein [Xylona heveae TC161]
MRPAAILSAVAALGFGVVSAQSNTVPVTGLLGNATVVTDNPVGVAYHAALPTSNKTSVTGSVHAETSGNGTGVVFHVSISGLPTSGGPFLYHIHEDPVPANGSCTATEAHLDPFKRGETPPCDPSLPETCQVGDLSGKHGKINGTSFSASYTDLYASTNPELGSFFGNRSVVVHFANKTRITCANFVLMSNTTSPSATPTSSHPASFTNGAATVAHAAGSFATAGVVGLAGLVAAMLV